MKTDSLAAQLLRGIGIGAAVVLAAANPYFGLRLIRGFNERNNKKSWRRFYASLLYLDRRGYVKILSNDDGRLKVKITRLGEGAIRKIDIETMHIEAPDQWDGKWRLVVFDVPNTKSKNRTNFTERLKSLGFIMVQKSVWAYPYECKDEVSVLRKFCEIDKYVTYLEVVEVEDELNWRGKFNLRN